MQFETKPRARVQAAVCGSFMKECQAQSPGAPFASNSSCSPWRGDFGAIAGRSLPRFPVLSVRVLGTDPAIPVLAP